MKSSYLMRGGHFGLLVLLIAWIALGRPASAQQEERLPLVQGFVHAPPLFQYTRDGRKSGFAIELGREIGKEIGVDIEIRDFNNSQELADAFVSGQVQLFAGVEVPIVPQESVVFSDRVASARIGLAVPIERVGTFQSRRMDGLRVGIMPPDVASDGSVLVAADNSVIWLSAFEAVMGLMNGSLNALMMPEEIVFGTARRARLDHRIAFVGEPILTADRAVGLHQSRADMLDDVNAAIARMQADGRLDALRTKYALNGIEPAPDVLRVGVIHFPPYQIVNNDGRIEGFGVEALRDLAELAGLKVEFDLVSLDEWTAGPSAATFDMLPQTAINDERLGRMDFTIPILTSTVSIFTRKGQSAGIKGLDDLKPLKTGIMSANLAREIVEAHGGLDVIETETETELVAALVNGRVDAIVFPSRTAWLVAKSAGFADEIEEVRPPVFVSERAPALRPGLGQVRERLNAVIPGYLISDDFAQLNTEYFGAPEFWTHQRLLFTWGVIGALFLAGAVAFFVSRIRARAAVKMLAERERQAAEVSSIRDELETVLNAATSGIVALDADGQIVRINNSARHMLGGISTETPFNWPCDVRFLSAESFAPLVESADPIRRALSGHVLDNEVYALRRAQADHVGHYVSVSSARLETSDTGIAVVLAIDDITQQERNRQVIERQNRLDALGQLTGGIAHDFNNLMASVLFSVEAAMDETDRHARNEILENAEATVVRGRDLTRRLLSFAKRQPGRATSRKVGAILEEFGKFIRPMVETRIDVQISFEDPELQVLCEQTQLETALMNLVLNSRDAILHSKQGNRIEITARKTPRLETEVPNPGGLGSEYHDCVEISVIDNGPGMDSAIVARATDPFFTTKGPDVGTGLGLSMVYGFVQQSDGDLQIISEPGGGTSVVMILPRGDVEHSADAPVNSDKPIRGNGETILLVEDKPELLSMAKTMLERLNYKVVASNSGKAAMDHVEAGETFDLLLTDVVMPGPIGGFELARLVREKNPELPVIYMSGYTGFSDSEMGAVKAPVLQKPASTKDMAMMISKALHGRG